MEAIRRYRGPLLIAVVSFSLIAYIYLNPPLANAALLGLGLPGDVDWYISRFALSTICFGVIPLAASLLLGFTLADLGLVWHKGMFRWKEYWLFFPVMVVAIASSAFNPEFAAFYPFSHTLADLARGSSWGYGLLHAVSYLLFYYIPWEILFRGLMVLPLVTYVEKNDVAARRANAGARNRGLKTIAVVQDKQSGETLESWKNPLLLTLAMLQTIPTVMIHFAHPLSESLGTVIFGVIGALIVLRTRSIIPVILMHACAGIVLDSMLMILG